MKTGRVGVLPNIKEEMQGSGRNNLHNRTVYGNQNRQSFQKNVSKTHSNGSNNSGQMNSGNAKADGFLQKVNNSILQAEENVANVKTLKLSLDVENVQLEAEDRDNMVGVGSPGKHKAYNSKYSNFTHISTVDTFYNALSKDAISPQGTRSDLQNTSLRNYISDKELPDGARKELVAMKEQMDRTIAGYEKKFSEILSDRQSLLQDNDALTSKLTAISRQLWTSDSEVGALQDGQKHSVEELQRMEQGHKADIDGQQTKLTVVEEQLNKRNEKQAVLVREQQSLSKNIEFNEKSRNECEKRIQDNELKLKKRLDDLNKSTNINYKDTIEMLYEKIGQLTNLLNASEEKNSKQENMLKSSSKK